MKGDTRASCRRQPSERTRSQLLFLLRIKGCGRKILRGGQSDDQALGLVTELPDNEASSVLSQSVWGCIGGSYILQSDPVMKPSALKFESMNALESSPRNDMIQERI